MKKLIHVLDKDKRKRKRVELFSNIPTKIQALGRSISAKIKDVSYSGIGIILSPNQDFLTMDSLETTIEFSNQIFQGRVANRVILPNQDIKIGLALPQEMHKEVDFNTTDSSWDRITDKETVQNIYNDLAFKGIQAPITLRQHFSSATIIPVKVTESETLICEILLIHQGNIERGKVKCTFDLFQTCHAFDSNIEKIENEKIELKLPETLARLLRRETARIQKKNAKFELKMTLSSKDFETKIEKYEIFDYSEHGISLLDPEGELSLPRNLVFDKAVIEVEGVGVILGKAEVRSYQWNRVLNAYIVGLKFEPNDDPHLTNWHNLILKARYPNLDFNYFEDDHKKIWKLFDISGYFEFKKEESFTDMIDLTTRSWKKLSDAGTQFSKKAMIRMEDEIVGHIQMDRIYDKTWCLHHLALDPSIRITVAQDLLSLTPDVLHSEGGKFVINFTDSSNTWNKKSYYNFIKEYKNPEHNALRDFVTYDLDLYKDEFSLLKSNKIEIKLANKYDLKRILNHINGHYKEIEIEACGFNEDSYLDKINSYLKPFGLHRERTYQVAFVNNELVGYSILESGSEGINIIGITNLCYVNIFKSIPEDIYNIAYESLLYEAVNFYKEKKINFMLFQLESPKQRYEEKGMRFMCNTNRWIATKDVFSRFSAYTNLLYGHLGLKRQMIRGKINDKKS